MLSQSLSTFSLCFTKDLTVCFHVTCITGVFGVLQAREGNRDASEERRTPVKKRSPEKREGKTPVMRTMFYASSIYSLAFLGLGCYRRSFTPFCAAFFPTRQTNP